MNSLRDNLKRDSILLQHICKWGIIYDSSAGRYGFECRTDEQTFIEILTKTRLAGLLFNNECFNSFIASAKGKIQNVGINWDRELPDELILPGEVILLNAGTQHKLRLIKIASGKYLIVESEKNDQLLISLYTHKSTRFTPGSFVDFDIIGTYPVQWIHILPPPRINRVLDYSISHLYNRTTVAENISELVPVIMQPLMTDQFEKNFSKIVSKFASCGISSWTMRVIVDAYVKKFII